MRTKDWGFYVTRKRERRFVFLSRWLWPLALLILLLIAGSMKAWPQSSDLSLNSSSELLRSWSDLYNDGLKISEQQRNDLAALREEITFLKIGSSELTNLSERLSESNESLRIYNEQIVQRMQTRDEDLARAYGDINRLEKQNLRLIIAITITGAVFLLLIIFTIVIAFRR